MSTWVHSVFQTPLKLYVALCQSSFLEDAVEVIYTLRQWSCLTPNFPPSCWLESDQDSTMWMMVAPEDVALRHCLEFLMTLWSKVHLTILDDYRSEEEKRNLNLLFVTGLLFGLLVITVSPYLCICCCCCC